MLRSIGLVLCFFVSQIVYSQDASFKGKHLFGISLGANVRSHSIDLSNEFLPEVGSAIKEANYKLRPGFELGTFYHYQFHPKFGFRIGGLISFMESEVEFKWEGFLNNTSLRKDESVLIEVPINFIFENYEKDIRPTFSLGGKFGYDVSNNASASNTIIRNSFSAFLEAGAGVAFRFSYFSFRPELIYSYGLSDRGTYAGIPAAALSKHSINHFAIRFSFYGV